MRSGALKLLEYQQDWQALPSGGTRIRITLTLEPTISSWACVPSRWPTTGTWTVGTR